MIAPARVAALAAISDVNASRRDLPAAIARVRQTLTDERDRALTNDLVTGALRWQHQLDFLIAHFAKRPLARFDFEVLQILRLGAYQIVHLDRVPESAAVNDAVALTRRVKKTSAAGLVNAVLRAIARSKDKDALPLPAKDDPLAYLELTLSHPRWLAARFLDRLGFADAERRETFNNSVPALTIRANRLKTNAAALTEKLAQHEVEVVPARFDPDALVVRSGNPLRTPLAESGLFFVQDEASQLVSRLATLRPGMRVLDACASPGGKTTAMAATVEGNAHIVAADVRNARIQLLRDTVKASGAPTIDIVQADLEAGLPFGPVFDLVFVDAPCSGLGTIRRDPDIRWRRHEDDLPMLAAAQVHMLGNAADAVGPDGTLIYATCSSEPEENDDVVTSFLAGARQSSFTLVDLRTAESPHRAVLDPVLDAHGMLRTLPEKHGLEAFFGAVLRRVK